MVTRFGISRGVSPREPLAGVGDLARAVEDHGFDALWFIDHQLGMKDVYTAMTLAALATERIEIGAGVTNLTTRHPTVTANATAALDEVSGGRALLGLGAGWVAVRSIGREPERLGAVRRGIEDFRRLFGGEEAELHGTRVRLATAARQVPIYLAVSQPGMLRLAGETCDGAIVMGAADPEFCRWQLDFIYEGLERSGRAREELTIDLFVTMSVDDDEARAVSDVRAWATSQAATFQVWKRIPPRLGAVPFRVPPRPGKLRVRGPPVASRRPQGARQPGVRSVGRDRGRPRFLHRAAARGRGPRLRPDHLRPPLRRAQPEARAARDGGAAGTSSGGKPGGRHGGAVTAPPREGPTEPSAKVRPRPAGVRRATQAAPAAPAARIRKTTGELP